MPAIVEWGTRDYVDALASMRELRAARRRGEIEDTLILVEHPPVLTVGVEGDDGVAEDAGLPIVHIERGGKGTYHGPGQLVGYPIVDLDARGHDVRRFVRDVEGLVIDALATFSLTAAHVPGRPGVWVGGGERKIASIGIAVEEWVTFHGFALNVANDLAPFERFHPCGFDGRIMTSMSVELGREMRVGEVALAVRAAWRSRFSGPPLVSAAPAPTPTAAARAG
jgi:lipoyl(octanoyl) transferase